MKKFLTLVIALCFIGLISASPTISKIAPVRIIASQVETQTASIATNMGLYGGKPEAIAVDPTSNNVYVTNFAPNGFYVSTDKGATWTGLPSGVNYGTGKSVTVDAASGIVYGLIGDTVIRSTDHGATFEDITPNLGSTGGLGSVALAAHGKALIAVRGAVAVSSDNGASFTTHAIETGSTITSLAAGPTYNTFYAVSSLNGSEKLFKSLDGGAVWTDMSVHSSGVSASWRISEVGADPLSAAHIVIVSSFGSAGGSFQTTDTGVTWTAVANGNQGSGHVTFDGAGRMYMGKGYSTNDGAGWTMLSNNTPLSTLYGDAFAIDPNNVNILFTNSAMGVAKSTDGGVTWTDCIDGITSVKTYSIAQANDKDYVWIGANGGLARSTDFRAAAPNWTYPILPAAGASNIKAVWVKPGDPDVVVAGLSTFLSKTSNGTAAAPSWTQATAPAFSGSVQQIVKAPNSNALYAVFYDDNLAGTDTGGVFKSMDFGTTWTDLDLPGNEPAGSVTVAIDGNVYVGLSSRDADTQTGIYKFSRGSWRHLTGGPADLQVTSVLADPDDADTIYATATDFPAGGGFYKSTDGGGTWNKITGGLSNINHLTALTAQTSTNPHTLYVSGQDGATLNGVIYKSSNAGESWSLYYTGLKQESYYSMLFDGLETGNDRGLYNIKSRARLSLRAVPSRVGRGQSTILRAGLRDIATGKKLSNRNLRIERRAGSRWRRIASIRTGRNGTAQLIVSVNRATRFRARWIPRAAARREYATPSPRAVRVRVR